MMRKFLTKKAKDRNGFTLVEMLACIIIITLMGIVLANGMKLAVYSYNRILFRTNSAVLEDSIDTAFAGLLRNASSVSGTTEDNIKFRNSMYTATSSSGSVIIADDEDEIFAGEFMLQSSSDPELQSMLVNKGEYLGMTVRWGCSGHDSEGLTYDSESRTFRGYYTIVSKDGSLSRDCSFTYKTLS